MSTETVGSLIEALKEFSSKKPIRLATPSFGEAVILSIYEADGVVWIDIGEVFDESDTSIPLGC